MSEYYRTCACVYCEKNRTYEESLMQKGYPRAQAIAIANNKYLKFCIGYVPDQQKESIMRDEAIFHEGRYTCRRLEELAAYLRVYESLPSNSEIEYQKIHDIFEYVKMFDWDIWEGVFNGKPNFTILQGVEQAFKFVMNFGFVTVVHTSTFSDEEIHFLLNEEEKALNCAWGAKLGGFDLGRVAFATSLKASIIMALVQYFQELYHGYEENRRNPGLKLVVNNTAYRQLPISR